MFFQEPRERELCMFLNTLKEFNERDMRPARLAQQKVPHFPDQLIPKMAGLGLFGLTIPEEFGGSGKGAVWSTWTNFALAYEWGAGHLIWGAHTSLAMRPILAFGTQAQKEYYLPKMVNGEMLGCFCLTEPDAGSDAASLRTRAEKVKDGYLLSGEKTFITNATDARVAIVAARTENGISNFIVETDRPGLISSSRIGSGISVKPIKKWVLEGSPYSSVFFDNVFVPEESLLGEEGKAFGKISLSTLELGRVAIAAQTIGFATCLFELAFDQVITRVQFRRRIWDSEAVQYRMADCRAKLLAAWALTMQASEMADRGESLGDIASCAKLFATEAAAEVEQSLAPLFGGMGVSEGHRLEELRGGIHVARVYEGAREVQQRIIAKSLNPR